MPTDPGNVPKPERSKEWMKNGAWFPVMLFLLFGLESLAFPAFPGETCTFVLREGDEANDDSAKVRSIRRVSGTAVRGGESREAGSEAPASRPRVRGPGVPPAGTPFRHIPS